MRIAIYGTWLDLIKHVQLLPPGDGGGESSSLKLLSVSLTAAEHVFLQLHGVNYNQLSAVYD